MSTLMQYALPISLPPVFSADNFFISGCNSEAFQWINSWPNWPAQAFLLSGEAGSGKSHLGHIWAQRAKAHIQQAAGWSLDGETLHTPLLLEDIEHMADERALFHLLNLAAQKPFPVLLTAKSPASRLPFTLPDLTSRLRALPGAHIAPPDDEVLLGVMRKQFADRQLKLDEEALSYMLARMERSFAAAGTLVERLDKAAFSQQKTLTIPFIKQWLD